MRNWADVLPSEVAKAQHGFERRRSAWRMREIGMTFREIGDKLGVGSQRAREIVLKHQRETRFGRRSPIEIYFDRGGSDYTAVSSWLKS